MRTNAVNRQVERFLSVAGGLRRLSDQRRINPDTLRD
jgi:hypothetical protein